MLHALIFLQSQITSILHHLQEQALSGNIGLLHPKQKGKKASEIKQFKKHSNMNVQVTINKSHFKFIINFFQLMTFYKNNQEFTNINLFIHSISN